MAKFYRWQEQARRKTFRLVAYFLLGVVTATFFMSVIGALIMMNSQSYGSFWQSTIELLPIFAALLLGTSVIRTLSLLIGGGRSVGRKLGGTPLKAGESEELSIEERRLRNVVEEMSLASGIAIPEIYILHDEMSINAFAAGLSKNKAIIGVTKGALLLLNREQLQGVVAHEFSHILNGDMRFNVILAGILLGLLGPLALFSIHWQVQIFSRALSRRNSGKAALGLGTILLIQLVVGVIGFFFISLIKAEIARQREYLADASAVQFTRNTAGLASALKVIGSHSEGSRLKNFNSVEFSHLLIAEGVFSFQENGAGASAKSFFTKIKQAMASHPPLRKRILKLEPKWDGIFPQVGMIFQNERTNTRQKENSVLEKRGGNFPEKIKEGLVTGAILAGSGSAGKRNFDREFASNDMSKAEKGLKSAVDQAIATLFAETAQECGGKYAPQLFIAAMKKAKLDEISMPQTGQYECLEAALTFLNGTLPQKQKEMLVEICYRMIAADKKVTVAEVKLYEKITTLLEVSAKSLDIPYGK